MMTMSYLLWPLVLTAFLFHAMPAWSRRDLFFAVSVRPDFRSTDAAAGIRLRYRIGVWIASAAAVGIQLATPFPSEIANLLAPVFLQLFGGGAAWARARSQVMPFAVQLSTVRAADLSPRSNDWPGGWPIVFGPLVILAATSMLLWQNWDQIPERFPIHWDIHGKPNGWSTRSIRGVFFPIWFGLAMSSTSSLMVWMIQTARRSAASPEEMLRERRHRRMNQGIAVGVSYFISIVFAYTALLPIWNRDQPPNLILVLVVTPIAVIVPIVAMSWRMAEENRQFPSAASTLLGDQTEDACWKLGQFYYNPADPAIMVEKRAGIGYTMNFARWQSWAFLAGVLLLPLGIVFLVK